MHEKYYFVKKSKIDKNRAKINCFGVPETLRALSTAVDTFPQREKRREKQARWTQSFHRGGVLSLERRLCEEILVYIVAAQIFCLGDETHEREKKFPCLEGIEGIGRGRRHRAQRLQPNVPPDRQAQGWHREWRWTWSFAPSTWVARLWLLLDRACSSFCSPVNDRVLAGTSPVSSPTLRCCVLRTGMKCLRVTTTEAICAICTAVAI